MTTRTDLAEFSQFYMAGSEVRTPSAIFRLIAVRIDTAIVARESSDPHS